MVLRCTGGTRLCVKRIIMSVAKVSFAILGLFLFFVCCAFIQNAPNSGLLSLILFAHLLIPAVFYFILKKGKEPEATFEEAWYENF
jgi:hypothetical protein